MSIVRWQRDCFVIPPCLAGRQARSDVIARTRNEEEAISWRHNICHDTTSFSLLLVTKTHELIRLIYNELRKINSIGIVF